MSAMYSAQLRERFSNICYQHIMPHLDRYQATPDLEHCLPLMEPEIYFDFADQACANVVKQIREIRGGDPSMLQSHLTDCLSDFGQALVRYAHEFERFNQVIRHAPHAAFHNGINVGTLAGDIAGGFLGNVGRTVAMLAGGFLGGQAVGKKVDAEGFRLQESFRQMLLAYDQGMGAVCETALSLITR